MDNNLMIRTLCFLWLSSWKIPSKHSTLIQRWYMLKERRDVGRRDIHVDSMLICQLWFIDKIQRWNNVDFRLTLNTILFSYHNALKLKSLYQRWKGNRIWTSKQCQLINVKSTSKFYVETTLILGWP